MESDEILEEIQDIDDDINSRRGVKEKVRDVIGGKRWYVGEGEKYVAFDDGILEKLRRIEPPEGMTLESVIVEAKNTVDFWNDKYQNAEPDKADNYRDIYERESQYQQVLEDGRYEELASYHLSKAILSWKVAEHEQREGKRMSQSKDSNVRSIGESKLGMVNYDRDRAVKSYRTAAFFARQPNILTATPAVSPLSSAK